MSEHALIFECEGERLLGVLHRPDATAAASRTGVVVIVGGPQYRVGSHRQFTLMSRAFCTEGYPVLRFDYRGMGDSDGESRDFERIDADIRVAIDTLMRECPQLEGVVLWGLCDAASACLMYANQGDARVTAAIIANPWVRTVAGEAKAYLKHYYLERLLQKSFWQKLLGGGLNPARALRELVGLYRKSLLREDRKVAGQEPQRSTMGFVERMYAGLRSSRFPVLLLISEVDLTAKEFLDLCQSQSAWQALLRSRAVQQEQLAGVDHTFSTHGALGSVNELCLGWMRRIGAPSP